MAEDIGFEVQTLNAKLKDFLKKNGWWAPAALSAFIAILSLITAIFSASAAKDSSESAKQSIRIQQILEKRALEDQRAKIEFSGGSITYAGIKEVSYSIQKHIYLVELKIRNYGVRPAIEVQIALNIANQDFKTDSRVVPGSLETQIFIELPMDKQVNSFDELATVGIVYYDQLPMLSTQSIVDGKSNTVCGPIEIRSISIYKADSNQGANTKFLLNAENVVLYSSKESTLSNQIKIPFRLTEILSNSSKNISCIN